MKKPVNVLLSIIGVAAALPVLAQSPDVPDHPALRDKFYLGAGVFLPKTSTSAQLNSSTLGIGTNVDFERTLGFEDSKSVPAFFGRWRFGERWRLEAEYFELNRSGTRTLNRDIQWGDRVFAANSQLSSTFDFSDLRASVGYSFFKTKDKELGAGIGVHAAKYAISLNTLNAGSENEKVTAPLPVLSLYGQFALTDRWAVGGRLDRFALNYDKYEGSLTSLNLDLLYQPFKNFGFGAGYRALAIRGKVTDARELEFQQTFQGPMLYVTASF